MQLLLSYTKTSTRRRQQEQGGEGQNQGPGMTFHTTHRHTYHSTHHATAARTNNLSSLSSSPSSSTLQVLVKVSKLLFVLLIILTNTMMLIATSNWFPNLAPVKKKHTGMKGTANMRSPLDETEQLKREMFTFFLGQPEIQPSLSASPTTHNQHQGLSPIVEDSSLLLSHSNGQAVTSMEENTTGRTPTNNTSTSVTKSTNPSDLGKPVAKNNSSNYQGIGRMVAPDITGTAAVVMNHQHDDPEEVTNRNSIAACLLTMDDNHFLIEWLAYHYHVLPLRHLIVAVDPRAKTSSQEIFNRWDGLMNITVWNDTHIFGDTANDTMANIHKTGNALLRLHRKRQMVLYGKCMRKFKADGHQWVILLDTDEFLAVQFKNEMYQPGSVLKYLKEAMIENITHTPPCLPLPRRYYSTKQIPLKPHQIENIPQGFNSSDFLTLRWRYHGMKGRNFLIKSMIDVSRVPWESLHTDERRAYAVHVPLELCGNRTRMPWADSELVVSHYAGTWEQYSFRDDARQPGTKGHTLKNNETYHMVLKRLIYYHDDLYQDWLAGFVDSVGTNEAQRLLEDVGKVATLNKTSSST